MRYEPVTVALGDPETIEHGNLSFDGDEARLVMCPEPTASPTSATTS